MKMRKFGKQTLFFVMAAAQSVSLGASHGAFAQVMEDLPPDNRYHEPWKGPSQEKKFSLGALAGMGIIYSEVGFVLLGTASTKIVEHGFSPDMTNNVLAEIEFGPVFVGGSTGVLYSAQLRWNFEKDRIWTFYALGGFGGQIITNANRFSPRFGLGALWTLSPVLRLRGEVTHDVLAVGVNFPI